MSVPRSHKLGALLDLFVREPSEAVDRLRTIVDVRVDNLVRRPSSLEPLPVGRILEELSDVFGTPAREYATEWSALRDELERAIDDHRTASPIAQAHNADMSLGQVCYLACRLRRPRVVVETGVAQGVTSRCILVALAANGRGELHSIDLPPLGADVDDYVGCLVPDDLRSRWTLHRGSSRRLLPRVLRDLGSIDVFVHDSLHTTRHIAFELNAVRPYLAERAVVLADDIEGNVAFERWSGREAALFSATGREQEKAGQFGVAVLP